MLMKSRALGSIMNTAAKYIPRLGRVAEDPLPTEAAPAIIHPTENPATPTRPTSPAQHMTPRTEPYHQARAPQIAPRTDPRHQTRASFVSRPDIKHKRPSWSPYEEHVPGRPRTKEDRARLNVRRRQEKKKKRLELDQIAAKSAELDAKRATVMREKKSLQEAKADFELSKEERAAKEAKIRETYEMPAVDGFKLKLRSVQKLDRERVKGPLFGPPREPYAPGDRIKEARAEAKRKRRELSPKVIPGPDGGGYGMNEKYFVVSDSDTDEATTDSPRTKKARIEEAKDTSLPIGDPHKAQPATGAYLNSEDDGPRLHGGNAFREADAIEETKARAAKAKASVPKMPPRTPDGREITNLSGHFTVPYSSESETGSDQDPVDIPTPAPKRSVKESLSEMSIFRKDREVSEREAREQARARAIEDYEDRSSSYMNLPRPGESLSDEMSTFRKDREAREAREREDRARATAEKFKDWPSGNMDSTARAESLPPIPPAPIPAHASLPQPRQWIPPPGFKTSGRDLKYLRAMEASAKAKAEQLKNEQAKVKAARAAALQHTPRRPSNLRESHLVDSSPSSPSGQSAPRTSAPSGKRVHFADDLISGPSGSTLSGTSRPAVPNPSPLISDPYQAVSPPSHAASETARAITGPVQTSSAHSPTLSAPAQAYPGPTQPFAGPAQAFPGSSPSLANVNANVIVDDVPTSRYPKDEMVNVDGMWVRGELLNYALDSIRDEDVEFELDQIRKEFADFARENPSPKPVVSSRVQDFLDSDACRKAIEEDTVSIAEGIRAGMARDFPL